MMVLKTNRDLASLVDPFESKIRALLQELQDNHGIKMKPFFTIRDPFEQAKIWRSTRSGHEISDKIDHLLKEDAYHLAYCLWSVGPQYSASKGHMTYALPGYSWHQFGKAVDCYWSRIDENGREYADWGKTAEGDHKYKIYATLAQKLGLTAGYFWDSKDRVHIQDNTHGSTAAIYSTQEIDDRMKKDFFTPEQVKTAYAFYEEYRKEV